MPSDVKTLKDQLDEVRARMYEIADGAAEQGNRGFTEAEDREFSALERQARAYVQKLEASKERQLPAFGSDGFRAMIRPGAADGSLLAGPGVSAGQAFVRSDEFRAVQARGPLSGPRAPIVVEIQAATLVSPTTGWPATTQLPPVPPAAPPRMPRVSELFARATAEGGNVPFITDASTGTAAPQTEAAAKSEITLVMPVTIMPVRTIAGLAKVSDQSLEDISGLAAWIDNVLGTKVFTELDRQVIAGTGTAPQLLGLLNVVGRTADYAMPGTGSDPATAILHQILAVEAASGFAVDAVVLAPNVYEALLNLKATTSGTYLSGAPISSSPMTLLWGRTLVYSPALAAGTALVGSFKSGAALFVKGGLRLAMTNADATDFQANVSTVRAEVRAALATWVPKAFGLVTALAA